MSLEAEVMRYWEMGHYDTAHIAVILGASEATVYNIVSHRPLSEKHEPAPPRIPYAGAEREYTTYYPNRFVRKDMQ